MEWKTVRKENGTEGKRYGRKTVRKENGTEGKRYGRKTVRKENGTEGKRYGTINVMFEHLIPEHVGYTRILDYTKTFENFVSNSDFIALPYYIIRVGKLTTSNQIIPERNH